LKAWYTASTSITANYGDAVEGKLNAGNATAQTQNYFLKLNFAAVSNVALTDYNGGLWALSKISNGDSDPGPETFTYYIIAAQLSGSQTKCGQITISSYEWYDTAEHAVAEGDTGKLSAGEKATITAQSIHLDFQGARVRFAEVASDPTATFSTAFGSTNTANTVKDVTIDIAAGGEPSFHTGLWFSLSGTAADSAIPTAGATSTDVDTYSAENNIGSYTAVAHVTI